MKRCPTCNRVEPDETLGFCRTDGTPLVSSSSLSTPDAATVRLEPGQGEIATSLLPQTTNTDISRATGPTTVLSPALTTSPSTGLSGPQTSILSKSPRSLILIFASVFIAAAVLAGYLYFTRKANTAIHSLAVMPFINQSANPDVDYLSDGMTETLINTLSQLPDLSVKAPSSVFRYKDKEVDPHTVGNELSVQAILNGRLVQRGNDLTLYLSLVDTRTGNQLWGEQYDRKAGDLLSLQKEVTRDVATKLKTRLSGSDVAKVAKDYTQNAEAYQLYLQGRYFWHKRTTQNIQKSIDYFHAAIQKDPNYALGYAGLSDGYALLGYYGGDPAQVAFPKAKEAALKALSLDENLAEAHNSYGFVLVLYEYDYAGSEREYRRVIELNPQYALARQNLGVMLNRIGRSAEGLAEIRRGLEIEPLSIIMNRLYADGLTGNRRYDEALAQLTKTYELDPSFPTTQLSFSALYQVTGKYAEAVDSYAKYLELTDKPQTAKFVRDSFASGGWHGYLKQMTSDSRREGVTPYMAANFFAQLGDKENAFAELNKAFDNREWQLLYVKIDPRMDPLRADPRFKDLLRRMHFPGE